MIKIFYPNFLSPYITVKNDEVINYEFTIKAHKKLSELGFEINYNLSDLLGHGIDEKGISIGESFIKKFFYI